MGGGMLRGPIQVDLATSYIERSIPGGGFVIGFTAHSTMLHKRKPKHLATPSYYYMFMYMIRLYWGFSSLCVINIWC